MNRLDEYIASQILIEPSPFLASKIMDRLENGGHRRMTIFRQSVAAVASIAAAILFGIIIGNGLKPVDYLTVNDERIENISILISDDIQ